MGRKSSVGFVSISQREARKDGKWISRRPMLDDRKFCDGNEHSKAKSLGM
jgi:hypothetical protein